MAERGRPSKAPDERKTTKSITVTDAVWEKVRRVGEENRWAPAAAASILIEEAIAAREARQ